MIYTDVVIRDGNFEFEDEEGLSKEDELITTSFNFLSHYFTKYPTGKMTHSLEDNRDIDLEVMYIYFKDNGGANYYLLSTIDPYKQCILVPFIKESYPKNIKWKFLTNTGRELTFNKRVIYEEEI